MAEYKIKGGYTISDEEIERLGEACERGDYPGEPGEWIVRPQGRPALSDEPLVNVNVKFPKSMVDAIDSKSKNRSDFIRKAVAAFL
ncbi:MAG: ribbon-helix-helix domain-containing protein [Atopobiaceae bacterium]